MPDRPEFLKNFKNMSENELISKIRTTSDKGCAFCRLFNCCGAVHSTAACPVDKPDVPLMSDPDLIVINPVNLFDVPQLAF